MSSPLAQLQPRNVDAASNEAIADWHYWIAMVYPHAISFSRNASVI
jgi:Calcium binding